MSVRCGGPKLMLVNLYRVSKSFVFAVAEIKQMKVIISEWYYIQTVRSVILHQTNRSSYITSGNSV